MQHGRDVADGTIVRLYRDVRTLHERLGRYDPDEVRRWLDRMQDEIEAYAGRMDSMCNAAIDETGFETRCERLRELGFELDRCSPLVDPASNLALAWALIGTLP